MRLLTDEGANVYVVTMAVLKTIGLVGGVASGKSRVAQLLVELGAGLVDADKAGHALLAEDAVAQEALLERWGNAVFKADGTVDRAAVAQRVFAAGNQGELDRQFLEDLLHPRIRRRLKAQIDQFAAEGRNVVVLDAALLFEAGWQPMCEIVLFVDAPRETRLERARQRGWSEAEFNRREAAQWPVEQKRRAADAMLVNDGSEAELRESVEDFWKRYVAR
jgi:dephospho-CoA kinase